MSDHVVQSDRDSDGVSRHTPHLYQSVWMAHWLHASYKPETQGHDPSSIHYQTKVYDSGIKHYGPELPHGISETGTIKDSLKPSSINFRKERLESRSFPMFNLSENRETVMSQKNVTSCHPGLVSEIGTSSREFRLKGIPRNVEWPPKYHEFLEQKSLAVSPPNQYDVGSSSKIVAYGYDKGKSPMHSSVGGQEDIHISGPVVASDEHFKNAKFQSCSMPLIQEDKTNNPFGFRRYWTSSSKQNNVLHNPSASNNELPVCVGKESEKMEKRSGTRLFPDWSSPLDASKSEILFHKFHSVPRIPRCVQDVKTMRISTTVDSMEELSPTPPKFSQTTHHFLITKKSDVNLSAGGERFKDSTFSTNFDGKTFRKVLDLSSDFGFQGQRSLKLEPIRSFTDSEEKENLGDAKTSAVCLKNESSAETDTMDMDVFQKDHLSGVVSSPKNKIVEGCHLASTSRASIASFRAETGGRLPIIELPDINEDLPALPSVANYVEDRETSSSRTQSLDVEHLLSHAELPTNSKSGAFPDALEGSDPSIRWVKRLKPNASDSSPYGTKSSKMEEACSHEKVNMFFSKIMRGNVTSSDIKVKCHGKEHMALDQTAVLLRNAESSSSDSLKKSQDVSLANPWIHRWFRQRGASSIKIHEARVICEPQKSNATLDKFQKKQFPSIAAMALMGKALNSLRPCEFRNRGPYIIWKT